jgi:hypothetical protein
MTSLRTWVWVALVVLVTMCGMVGASGWLAIPIGATARMLIKNFSAEEREADRIKPLVNQLAGVLADLHLIRPLTSSELKRFGREETRSNMTDLRAIEAQDARGGRLSREVSKLPWTQWLPATLNQTHNGGGRHHGLLSKAQRVLHIAGWSPAAQDEIEIFRLVDCEGLTPLLALFNEATLEKGAETLEALRKERDLLGDATPLQLAQDH